MPDIIECSECLFDTTIPELTFDQKGVCNYCRLHHRMNQYYPRDSKGTKIIHKLVNDIKGSKKRKYDCIVGVSGGVDSSFTLLITKILGLNPLAVHIDNGWNSELAVDNIHNIVNKLGVDLHTEVLDWISFRDLQLSFLKASVPDGEVPTDITLLPVLYRISRKLGIKYVVVGSNSRAQGLSPIGWTYMDKKYVYSVQNEFGNADISSIPTLSIPELLYTVLIKQIKTVSFLEYLNYDTEIAKKILKDKLDWRPYKEKHYESSYTKFFQGYVLYTKFKIDKRKIYLSTLIRNGKLNRKSAKEKLEKMPYISSEDLNKDKKFVIKKLGISAQTFDRLMSLPIKNYRDFQTYLEWIHTLRHPIKMACSFGLIPHSFYEKYVNIFH